MQGRIVKIISDFYYADTAMGIIEAKLCGAAKKRGDDVYIGDYVKLVQFDEKSMQAFISEIMPRTSVLSRPKSANVSQVLIVSALKEPDLDFEQLDRFIAFTIYHKLKPILCFNKEDIKGADEVKQKIEKIYKPLGFESVFVSAAAKTGLDELRSILKNNVTVPAGVSGAGKSSIINALLNAPLLKTCSVSAKTSRGTHTTRWCEFIKIDENTYTADTPGFSRLKFDFLLPAEIQLLFPEFKNKLDKCAYKNCLHTGGNGCAFDKTLAADTRYSSYLKFVKEAQEYEDKISKQSIKQETKSKYNKNKLTAKISAKKRSLSRKTINQNVYRNTINNE